METTGRRRGAALLALGLAGASLAACGVSVTAGAVGGGLALGLAGWLLLGTLGAAQSGCAEDSDPSPDPDPDEDARVGPCLSDASVGPCLSPPAPDAGPDFNVGPCLGAPFPDAYVGPCLSPPPPDAGPDTNIGPCLSGAEVPPEFPDAFSPDAHVGPCLEPPLPDAGPDANVGPCLSQQVPDARVGPCLDIDVDAAVPDAARPDARQSRATPVDREREAVLERLLAENRLPADVAARLRKS